MVVVTRPRWWRYREDDRPAKALEARAREALSRAEAWQANFPELAATPGVLPPTEEYAPQRDTVLEALRAQADEATEEAPAPPRSATEAGEDEAPGTVPLPPILKAEPLPPGVLGYAVVVTQKLGYGRDKDAPGYLASSDLMTRDRAEHVIGNWPESLGTARLAEIREVTQ